MVLVKQRKYIQDFIDFTGSFLLTEQATIDELNLVKANLDILSKRIADFGETKIGGEYSEKEYPDCGGSDGKCQCWDGEDCKEHGQQGQGV